MQNLSSLNMKNLLASLLLLLLQTTVVQAQNGQNPNYEQYIRQYNAIAVEEMRKFHIPASITLAQGILESAAGQSDLCRKGNNHFGIKCHEWSGGKVYHDDDEQQECFRAYKNARESYEDHSLFLSTSSRYSQLFRLAQTDYKGWARGLKACGYATNPQYAETLIGLIERYRLYEYDQPSSGSSTTQQFNSSTIQQLNSSTVQQLNKHSLFINNKRVCLKAHAGDTFKLLGKEVGIRAGRLARYNERPKVDRLAEGDFVYLKKKARHAEKPYRKMTHIVQPGESMYTIAQLYGIRLKALYDKNKLPADHQARQGEHLIIP